nr:DNA mismatch repair endonuclease MutH [Dongshaea marina]
MPPGSEEQLLQRAEQLAGLSMAELAEIAQIQIPKDLRRDKGWIGQMLELHLGAEAGSKPEQDFPELGIELKTIPVDQLGKPTETTFVCVAPLYDILGLSWESSSVRNKLSRVLWIPIEYNRQLPLAERRVGTPLIWSPSAEEERKLRQDWEELMEMIALGEVESITARTGQALQLRPKAANRKALTRAIGSDGQTIMTLPRGFYLKTQFTHEILKRHFML